MNKIFEIQYTCEQFTILLKNERKYFESQKEWPEGPLKAQYRQKTFCIVQHNKESPLQSNPLLYWKTYFISTLLPN